MQQILVSVQQKKLVNGWQQCASILRDVTGALAFALEALDEAHKASPSGFPRDLEKATKLASARGQLRLARDYLSAVSKGTGA